MSEQTSEGVVAAQHVPVSHHTPTPAPVVKTPQKPLARVANWRGSQSDFRMGKMAAWFSRLMAEEILAMTQSESDGNISVSLIYR